MTKILSLLLLLVAPASAFQVGASPKRLFTRPSSPHAASTTVLRESALVDSLQQAVSVLDSPLATTSALSGLLCGVGDALAQKTEQMKSMQNGQDKPFDADRCIRFTLTGLGSGIIWGGWYEWSDAYSADVGEKMLSALGFPTEGGFAAVRTSICILLDQFLGSPVIYGLWSIPMPLLLSGMPLDVTTDQVQSKLPAILVENAKVWTLANLVIYNVPLEWRVIAMSLTNILWQTIMSSTISADEPAVVSWTEEDNLQGEFIAPTFDTLAYEHAVPETLSHVNYNGTDSGASAV